jgi:hypothetical protein
LENDIKRLNKKIDLIKPKLKINSLIVNINPTAHWAAKPE